MVLDVVHEVFAKEADHRGNRERADQPVPAFHGDAYLAILVNICTLPLSRISPVGLSYLAWSAFTTMSLCVIVTWPRQSSEPPVSGMMASALIFAPLGRV